MARVDLYNLAREFAHDVNDLLNHTVCDGARLVAGTNPVTGHCVIAPRVDRLGRPTEESVPLRLGRRRPTGHLTVLFTTQLDPEEQYLAVDKSRFGLCLDPDGDARGVLLHYDYIREPYNVYPGAHIQVGGVSAVLHAWCHGMKVRPKELHRLHLPVGGKRYRPGLEDVIEFLVVEGLATARPGWEAAVERHRERWMERQLRAAVRRDPESAAAELRDAGYMVFRPTAEAELVPSPN